MTADILFLTSYTGIGGGETLQLNLMRSMEQGQEPGRFRLHLLTPRLGPFPQAAASLGIATHVIPYRGTTTYFVPWLWARLPIVGKLRTFLYEQSIRAILSDYHSLPFIVPAAESLGIPVIWNAMGWWFPIYRWQQAFFQHQIQRIIAITGAVKDKLLGNPPVIPPDCIDVLIPGVDPSVHHPDIDGTPVRQKLQIGPDVPLVAMVARFQNVKGHEYFLQAAQQILKDVPDARFAVAGENVFAVSKDEKYKQSILKTVESDSLLRERVTYLGFWPDAREVIAAADVMVCSSWFESLSMVALESMAMQRPIVSTSVGGPAETVADGVTGYLVPPRDSRAIADKVIKLLGDPALRMQMGSAGRAHVLANFTAQRYAAGIGKVIDQALTSTPILASSD